MKNQIELVKASRLLKENGYKLIKEYNTNRNHKWTIKCLVDNEDYSQEAAEFLVSKYPFHTVEDIKYRYEEKSLDEVDITELEDEGYDFVELSNGNVLIKL